MKTNSSVFAGATALAILIVLTLTTPLSAPGATLDSAFTFQGRLVAGGSPANGSFDLRLTLFNSVSGGSQIGATLTNLNVAVSNGLFSTLVDFGNAVFDGTTYWVEVGVRPAGTANPFRTLAPRQRLAGTPYALFAANASQATSVPWSGLTAVPPGFSDGVDNDTLYSAGAGLQLGSTQFSVQFAGSGLAATAARSDHTHSGGDIVTGLIAASVIDPSITRDSEVFNLVKAADGPGSELDADTLDGFGASGFWTTGGNTAVANRDYLGTDNNTPLELRANSVRVLRLDPNTTSPNILGGYQGNFVAAGAAGVTIAGGGTRNDGTGAVRTNRVSASYGTIGGGFGHGVDGIGGTIGGGRDNAIKSSATNATISGGASALAINVGQSAYASGSFASPGDAQASTYVVRGVTTTSVPLNLALDGSGAAMTIPVGGRWAFEALVIASTSGSSTAAYQLRGAIRNISGTTTLLPGAPAVTSLGADGATAPWSVTAVGDNTLDALVIRVVGASAGTVRWVATVRVVELSF